jgi:hypothetical protein
VSFLKIISARSDDAIRTELAIIVPDPGEAAAHAKTSFQFKVTHVMTGRDLVRHKLAVPSCRMSAGYRGTADALARLRADARGHQEFGGGSALLVCFKAGFT